MADQRETGLSKLFDLGVIRSRLRFVRFISKLIHKIASASPNNNAANTNHGHLYCRFGGCGLSCKGCSFIRSQSGLARLAHEMFSKKPSSLIRRVGWRSFLSALASIWRMRSRVTLYCLPTSSSVRG